MPAVMRNRFALNPLSGERALAVIVQAGGQWVSDDVARDIVAAVAGGTEGSEITPEFAAQAEIEPAYLSVMCHELFERMLTLGGTAITRDLVKQEHGGILESLYERSFEGLEPRARYFVEERLLTASGFRAAVPVTEALREGMTAQDLDTLVNRRLLRFEDRLGVSHVELSHDLLTGVVLRSRDIRRLHEVQQKEVQRQEALRLQFRSRVKSAIIGSAAAALVLGALGGFAIYEQNQAWDARDQAQAEQIKADQATAASQAALQKFEQMRSEAEGQKQRADTEKHEADASRLETVAFKGKTTQFFGGMMKSNDDYIRSTYQNTLKELDTYYKTTDDTVKNTLKSSLAEQVKNMQDQLKSVEGILKLEPNDPFVRSVKINLLFAIADLEARAYGYDYQKYNSFITYTQSMMNEKDPWMQAEALRGIADAAGIMIRKPDLNAADSLLSEVREKGAAIQKSDSAHGLTAQTWDALEDAYAECATLQEYRDPKDARAWYTLAVQAQTKSADLDKKYWQNVAQVTYNFGDFEEKQGDHEAAIREYTAAINAYKEDLRIQNAGKPDHSLISYIIARADAEDQAGNTDAARKDYQECASLAEKLDPNSDNRYQELVAVERLGDLEMKANNYQSALNFYKQEQQIALALAEGDSQRRNTVAFAYKRVSRALNALGNKADARTQLVELVSTWDSWTKGTLVEADERAYVDSLLALGDFDFQQGDYPNALKSYDTASSTSTLLVVKWTSQSNMVLLVRNNFVLAQSYQHLQQPDRAYKAFQDARTFAMDAIDEDCESNIDLYRDFETVGSQSLIDLKNFDQARIEAKAAMQLAETKCGSINDQSSQKLKTSMAEFWGDLSWAFLRSGGADDLALTCAQRGIALDPTQAWIKVNLAHAYLLTGNTAMAKSLYSSIKDLPWGDHLLKVDIRDDFKALTSLGRQIPDKDEILNSLGPDK
jgi:tetratricopeptide (TPR) repeat protein